MVIGVWGGVLAGKPPYNGANHMQLLRNIQRAEARLPESLAARLSAECVALIHGLLQRDPVQRMSWEEFFGHPFVSEGECGCFVGAEGWGERAAGGYLDMLRATAALHSSC